MRRDVIATRKIGRWRLVLGLIVSAAGAGLLLWLVDWRDTVETLQTMDITWVALGAVMLLGCYATFAIRWWVLLRCDPALPPPRLFSALMMGLAVNVGLPLRPGDALRVYLVGHIYRGGTSRVLGSIILERLFDVAVILFLGGIVARWVQLPESMRGMLIGTTVLMTVAAAVILALVLFARPINSFLARLTAASTRRWASFAAHHFAEFSDAMAMGGSPSQWGLAAIASLIGWGSYSAAMTACGVAFGISTPVTGGVLMAVLTNLGGMIPASPGSIGVYHALAVLALSVTGTPQGPALAVAIVSHALIVVMQLVLGLLAFAGESSLVRQAIKRRQLQDLSEET